MLLDSMFMVLVSIEFISLFVFRSHRKLVDLKLIFYENVF